MAGDTFTHEPPPPPPPGDWPPPPPPPVVRRPLGGLGRVRATALVAAGLLIGGGAGGFVIANAATTSPSPSASAAPGTGSAGSGSTTHPCPNMGGSSSGPAGAASYNF